MKNGNTSIHNTGLTKEEMAVSGDKYHQGLTKREHLAAMAMQGLCTMGTDNSMPEYYADMAVKHADALLEALENDK